MLWPWLSHSAMTCSCMRIRLSVWLCAWLQAKPSQAAGAAILAQCAWHGSHCRATSGRCCCTYTGQSIGQWPGMEGCIAGSCSNSPNGHPQPYFMASYLFLCAAQVRVHVLCWRGQWVFSLLRLICKCLYLCCTGKECMCKQSRCLTLPDSLASLPAA